MKKNKKVSILFLIAVVLLAVTLIYVGLTYARYTGTVTGTGEAQVAEWAAVVGDADLAAGDTTMTAPLIFTPVANAHVATGKVAPATTATTTFDIDPTGAEVSMEYEFTLGTITSDGTAPAPNKFTITKVEATYKGTTSTITPASGKYSGSIDLSGLAKLTVAEKVTVTVTVAWTNDEAENANDTLVGIEAPKLSIPVSVTVRQKI